MNSLVSFLVVFTFLTNICLPVIVTATPTEYKNGRTVGPTSTKYSQFLSAIVNARSENEPAPKLTLAEANILSLNNQSLVLPGQPDKAMTLGRDSLRLPTPNITQVDKETDISLQNDDIVITETKTGIQHKVSGLEPKRFMQNDRWVYIFSHDGTVSVISKDYIKEFAFNSPIPVFKVAISKSMATEVQMVGDIKKISPPRLAQSLSDSKETLHFQEGDLLLLNSNHEVHDVVSARHISEQVHVQSLFLSFLCIGANPDLLKSESFIKSTIDENSLSLDKAKEMLNEPSVKQAMIQMENLDLFGALPIESVKRLTQKANEIRSGSTQADRTSLSQWSEAFEQHHAQQADNQKTAGRVQATLDKLKTGQQKFLDGTRNFLKSTINKKNVSTLAKTMAVMAGAAALDTVTGNQASQWAVSMGTKLWDASIPDVLLDPSLRDATIRANLILYMSLPVITAVGALASRYTNWSTKKTLAVAGLRTFGLAQGIIYYPVKFMARQKNLFSGLVAGANPVQVTKTLNSPFASNETLAQNSISINETLRNKKRVELVAYLIAHQVVAQTEGIDPLSVMALTLNSEKNLSESQIKEWGLISAGLQKELADLPADLLEKMISGIDAPLLQSFIKKAEDLKVRLQQDSGYKKRLQSISQRLRKIWETELPKKAGYMTYESHRRLMTADPSAPVYNHYLRKFFVDYTFGLAFYSLWGGRADLKNPQDLVADPKGPMGINKSHLADVSDWNLQYAVVNPANLYLDYDDAKGDKTKNPTQSQESLSIRPRTARFSETAGHFLRTAIDLPRANYGHYFMRALVQTSWTLPAAMTMGIFSRTVFMQQGLGDAIPATFWTLATAMWAYAWPWIFVDRGTILHEQEIAQRWERFLATTQELSLAINEKDSKRSNSPYCQGIDLMPIMTSASRSKSSAFLHFGISLNKYFIASKIFTSFTLAVQSKL
jgi:uncharacterized membrane-anchored protein YjiN (DUF445 family)